MRIYIPSMGRSGQVHAGPLADINEPLEYVDEIVYVVPVSEVDAYMVATAPWRDIGVRVMGVGASGIAKTRLRIGEHAEDSGVRKFLMLDDDIRFLVRRDTDTWQLRGTQDDEVDQLMLHITRLLDEHGHVGVSAREGNNRIGTGEPPLVAVNTRTLRALAYRTDAFLSVEHCRVEVMEDFDVNLQLLERGLSNCSIHYWAQGQKMTNAPGGCSTYRTHEVHEASARRLAELHPGIVSLRQKQNKTDRDGFGTRTEVTIQWKRAYSG